MSNPLLEAFFKDAIARLGQLAPLFSVAHWKEEEARRLLRLDLRLVRGLLLSSSTWVVWRPKRWRISSVTEVSNSRVFRRYPRSENF